MGGKTMQDPITTVDYNPADIPVVILCGGMGTRLREASEKLPKPLVDIGGKPILWHIMKTYGTTASVASSCAWATRVTRSGATSWTTGSTRTTSPCDLGGGRTAAVPRRGEAEDWEITFVETGLLTGTGGRVKRVADHLDADTFLLTYGDGIGDVDIDRPAQAAPRRRAGSARSPACTRPAATARCTSTATGVTEFNEKPTLADRLGQRRLLRLRPDHDRQVPRRRRRTCCSRRSRCRPLAADGELGVFQHEGFWMGMDTFRDWTELNGLWDAGNPPWKVWDD